MKEILKYFPDLTPIQIEQLSGFCREVSTWNQHLNLVSRKDIQHLYERHILHSLGIAACHTIPDNSRVLDVGTGGGFPGIPLAIFFPRTSFTLVDSIGKKINAVRAISDKLGLLNVAVRLARAENIKDRYHYITGRAVTGLGRFTVWVKGRIQEPGPGFPGNGILYLKGGDMTEELKLFPGDELYHLDKYFSGSFFETKKLIYLPFKAL